LVRGRGSKRETKAKAFLVVSSGRKDLESLIILASPQTWGQHLVHGPWAGGILS
jgi:hypothetical protein